MTTSGRTKSARFQAACVTAAQEMKTVEHIRSIEAAEYLKMQDHVSRGASCKTCTHFHKVQFTTKCGYHSKVIHHYNICTKFQKKGTTK